METEKNQTAAERIAALRKEMSNKGIAYMLIFTDDYHQSEYVSEYFQARAYFSGFTGSAGTLLVGHKMAGLWTDGRYFIQANRQLAGSGITLFKMGEQGVPSVLQFLKENLKEGESLAFDARTIPAKEGRKYAGLLAEKKGTLIFDEEMTDLVWKDRPAMPGQPAFLLEKQYSGMETFEKLAKVRKTMEEKGATVHLLSSLDDIAWLFNIRGNDIPCNPVVLSYAAVTMTEACLFADEKKFDPAQREKLREQGVSLKEYNGLFSYVRNLSGEKVLLDEDKISYAIVNALPKEAQVIDGQNPEMLFKAVKNRREIENLKAAHIKDGIACVRFMRWIKEAVKTERITEWDASEYLEQLRREQKGFIELSFPTICAYKENGAMMHYSAKKDDCAVLEPEGTLLVDSGGQYLEGTTDITRTYCLGPVSSQVKYHFTLVLKGMLHLQNARFLYGCSGQNLDILARGPMWNVDLDYKCGTGHGVGYLLNVHEAPNGFRWKKVPERNDSCVLEAGMVTTDEPGIYVEGSHGIRTENELLCVKGVENEYGQFMHFEPLTVVPIDLELVEESLLSREDISQLNAYHRFVYETLSPHLEEEERRWLADVTEAL